MLDSVGYIKCGVEVAFCCFFFLGELCGEQHVLLGGQFGYQIEKLEHKADVLEAKFR